MKAITGEVDFARMNASSSKLPVYKANEQQGGYTTMIADTLGDFACFYMNHTYDDEAWREVANDVRFRRALMLAIDKEEIVEDILLGLASVATQAGIPDYDPDQANQLLDEMGMTQRDKDGFRMTPSGKELDILMEIRAIMPSFVPTAELLVDYFREIGIRATLKQISGRLFVQKFRSNELQATVERSQTRMWYTSSPTNALVGFTGWGKAWRTWYDTGGEEGEEPPAWVKENIALVERMSTLPPGSEEQRAAGDELTAWYRENLPILILAENSKHPLIVSNRLGNVPHSGDVEDINYSGEQFFFKE